MTDDALRAAVEAELASDPKLDDGAIAVSADRGVIALRGTVGTLSERYVAKCDAERVRGVISVSNQLEVDFIEGEVVPSGAVTDDVES